MIYRTLLCLVLIASALTDAARPNKRKTRARRRLLKEFVVKELTPDYVSLFFRSLWFDHIGSCGCVGEEHGRCYM